jgi:hypothetical protein
LRGMENCGGRTYITGKVGRFYEDEPMDEKTN